MVASAASTRGAPSKPTLARWASRAWVASQQGAAGRRTVSPTRTTRPRLAVPPRSGWPRSADGRGLGTSSVAAVHAAEQGSGETRVGDKAMDKPSSDRGPHRVAFRGVVGDGKDEWDLGEQRGRGHDHPAVERGAERPAVGADE